MLRRFQETPPELLVASKAQVSVMLLQIQHKASTNKCASLYISRFVGCAQLPQILIDQSVKYSNRAVTSCYKNYTIALSS